MNERGNAPLDLSDFVPAAGERQAVAQMDLFRGGRPPEDDAVIEEIRAADVERLSPLDALMRLAEWKGRLGKGST